MIFPIETTIAIAVIFLAAGILYWLVESVAPILYFLINVAIIVMLLVIALNNPIIEVRYIGKAIALIVGTIALILVFTPFYRLPWIWHPKNESWKGALRALGAFIFCVFCLLVQWLTSYR